MLYMLKQGLFTVNTGREAAPFYLQFSLKIGDVAYVQEHFFLDNLPSPGEVSTVGIKL